MDNHVNQGAIFHNSSVQTLNQNYYLPLGEEPSQIRYRPLAQNLYFIERKQIALAKILEALTADKKILISGGAGHGKTQVANQYVYQYESQYKYIFWIEADTEFQIIASLRNILRKLKIECEDSSNTYNKMWDWLDTHTDWLLVLNNSDDFELIKDFLSFATNGHIIVTSRLINMPSIRQVTDLAIYDKEEAVSFLVSRLNGERTQVQEELDALIERLAFHPLALEQAVSFLQENPLENISSYLEILDEGFSETSSFPAQEGFVSPLTPEERKAIWTTWNISINIVRKLNPFVTDLMSFSAHLNPDSIDIGIIKEFSRLNSISEEVANAAIQVLNKYSLIKLNAEKCGYSLHRLLQEVVKAQSNDNRADLINIVNTFDSLLPQDFRYPDEIRLFESLITHIMTLMPLTELPGGRASVDIFIKAGKYLHFMEGYKESYSLFSRASELNHSSSTQDIFQGVAVKVLLGRACKFLERYEEAELLYKKAIGEAARSFGKDSPDTCTIINNLAKLHEDQGLLKTALFLHEKILPKRRMHVLQCRYQGIVNKQIQRNLEESLHNLGGLYITLMRFQEALEILYEGLGLAKNEYGPSSVEVSRVLSALGDCYDEMGYKRIALQYFEESYDIFNLHNGHFDSKVVALNKIARAYAHIGRREKARCEFEKLKDMIASVKLNSRRAKSIVLNDMGEFYEEESSASEYVKYYSRALEALGPLKNEKNELLGNILVNLGRALAEAGDVITGKAKILEGLNILKQSYPDDHLFVLKAEQAFKNV